LLTAVSGADVVTPTRTPSPDGPIREGSGIVAHVVDAKSGQMSIYVGTKHVAYTNQALAQELLKASQ
jgi:hypothetical protein